MMLLELYFRRSWEIRNRNRSSVRLTPIRTLVMMQCSSGEVSKDEIPGATSL